ncbi:MAG: cytochrome c, partial [Dehalococcoidia bacterium]
DEGGSLRMHEIKDLSAFIKNWDSTLLEELLAEEVTTPTPTFTAEGKQLFSDQGCIACHKINGEGGEVGASMARLFGSERELTTGEKVTADHEYLEESIEDPGAKVVKGYPAGIMPDLGLRHDQVDALIEFIESLAE